MMKVSAPARPDLSGLGSPETLSHFDGSTPSSPSLTPLTPISPLVPGETELADDFAFAFDIDGVLIRGGEPIPEAVEAMKVLNGENEYGIKV